VPRAALAGGIALGVGLGGAGIAFAATSSSSTTPTTTPAKPGAPELPDGRHLLRPGFGFGFGGPGLGLGRVIHGQFTVPEGSGYKTLEVQLGTVSALTSSSITVTSADHYQHKYALTSSTIVNSQLHGISSVAKGDQVRILASTDTAISITDITKIGDSIHAFGFGTAGPLWGAPNGAKAPAAATGTD
jgi:hypothetical protein